MPERTCIGCRTPRPQARMLRFRRRPDGQVIPVTGRRPQGRGRGAYLCPKRSCLTQARKRRGFTRAFARSGRIGLDPKQDGPWEALWTDARAEVCREIELLTRTTRHPHEHPRRRGLEDILFELSSQPALPGATPTVSPSNRGLRHTEAAVSTDNNERERNGGPDHG